MKLLLSIVNLGLKFLIHFVLMPFRRRAWDKERFLASYSPERLLPQTIGARGQLPSFERCIACGLCNTLCTTLATAPRHLYGGPASLAITARSFTDFPELAAHLEYEAKCGTCRDCTGLCPTGVPLRELAEHVRTHGRKIQSSVNRQPPRGVVQPSPVSREKP